MSNTYSYHDRMWDNYEFCLDSFKTLLEYAVEIGDENLYELVFSIFNRLNFSEYEDE